MMRPTLSSSLYGLSRRQLLKAGGAAVLTTPFVSRAWAATTEINMLAWYGHGEPDMVAEYEAANNVKFVPKYYAGGDNMLALIAQSPPGTYDLILSDGEFVQQLNLAGYIDEMNPADYPLDDMLHEDFKQFPGHWADGKMYSMMLRGGHLGVSYNKNSVTAEEAASYECFWKPELEGKVGHFDWHLPTLGMMSLYNGNGASLWDIDDAKWAAVQETTMGLRKQVGGFFDYGGTFNGLKNGDMQAMVGIGDWITTPVASGRVERFTLRATQIRDVSGTVWHIPNGSVEGVGNKSQNWARAVVDVAVSVDSDVEAARAVIAGAAAQFAESGSKTSGLLVSHPIDQGVIDMGAQGVTLRVVVDTEPSAQWEVERELRQHIKAALDQAGIRLQIHHISGGES